MTGWGSKFFYPHEVLIQSMTGGGLGKRPGAPRTVAAEVKDEQLLVRDVDGSEVISSTQVTVAATEQVKPGALVTVWPGADGERTAKVIRIDRHDDMPPLPSFLVLSLE